MSFDLVYYRRLHHVWCLNPFRSGQCLSTVDGQYVGGEHARLNPFRSGQCLSTK